MPLLDHFRPPLSHERHWESFHASWAGSIADALNRSLPEGYFAEELTHAGANTEIDVATFEADVASGGGEVAVAPAVWAPPKPLAVIPAVFADDFEVRVFSSRSGPTLVAAIELISPANKDRPEARRAFATKCAGYLHQGIALVMIDVVTDRHTCLHNELLALMNAADGRLSGTASLYGGAYRPLKREEQESIEVWAVPLELGRTLPTLPLWINAGQCLPLKLEPSYADACSRRRIAMT